VYTNPSRCPTNPNPLLKLKNTCSRVIHLANFSSEIKTNLKEKSLYAIVVDPLNDHNSLEHKFNPKIPLIEEHDKKNYKGVMDI
jgi:hypothetical protein